MTTRPSRIKLSVFVALAAAFAAAAATQQSADKRLEAQAEQIAQTQLKRLGAGYVARADLQRHLVYVSALDEKHLRETAGLLAAFTDACRHTILAEPLAWNVTVILPTADDYAKLRPSEKVRGFYRPGDRTLISIDRGRVLLHEFTHALHHADAAAAKQIHPIWICEGLASLLESSEIAPEGLRPNVDVHVLTLQQALRGDSAIGLERLFKMDNAAFARKAGLCYAEARYVMLYLHQQGKLRLWYEQYKAWYAKDGTGRKAMERVLGKGLPQIEEDWKKWAERLELPWGETRSHQGRLGLQFQDTSQGVKVVGFVAGGAAEKAGRIKVGDVIREFNGHATGNTAELVAAIRAAGAHRTVTVEVLRHGQRVTIRQPLGAPEPGR